MKTCLVVVATLAALPLAACGGSQETANTVVTENVFDDGASNGVAASDIGLENATFGNDLTVDNGFDTATAVDNGLTAVDNSR